MNLSELPVPKLEKMASTLKMQMNQYGELFDVSVSQEGTITKIIAEKVGGITHLVMSGELETVRAFARKHKLTWIVSRITGQGIKIDLW